MRVFGGGKTPPGADCDEEDDGCVLWAAAAAAAAAAATAAESAKGPVWIMFVPIGWLLPLVPSIFDHGFVTFEHILCRRILRWPAAARLAESREQSANLTHNIIIWKVERLINSQSKRLSLQPGSRSTMKS